MNLPPSGILLLDKPVGISSQNAVTQVRQMLNTKTIGHTGTLDPMASGLLIICYGRATRTIEYIDKSFKTYQVNILLGTETDTYDLSGKVLQQAPVSVSKETFESVLQEFIGKQEQIPPMYSAIHYNGQRLYELARSGKHVELSPREITISSIRLLSCEQNGSNFNFELTCSKGTYIRSLCHDIGKKLGTYATMAALRRTSIGIFSIDQAISLNSIKDKASSDNFDFILPTDLFFSRYPILYTSEDGEKFVRNGSTVPLSLFSSNFPYGNYRLYHQDRFIAFGKLNENGFFTEKNFYEL